MEKDYDFSGWATKNGLRCSDGRVICQNAFAENDNSIVSLVWNHQHNSPDNVLGHALLKNMKDGVYAYGYFNDTENGRTAKALVQHGDIRMMSIYANQLRHNGADVIHGNIREVSLVHAGANPGAVIDSVLSHSDDGRDEEGPITTGIPFDEIAHSDDEIEEVQEEETDMKDDFKEEMRHADDSNETIGDVFNTLTDKQKNVVYAMIGMAIEDNDSKDSEGDEEDMKHNVFDNEDRTEENTLSHSEMQAIFSDVKRYGTLKESVLAHGIEQIDWLFPEAKTLNNPPDWISREMGWVQKVMSAVHHTPFSRIKSMFADITEDEARAKGYIKGKLKKEEVFSLLKRTTTPTTIYKKQKLDRDDVIDITDFDVVAWLKGEMRMMLNEELARAFLIGDGRLSSSDDKINESNIRPIAFDDELYTISVQVPEVDDSDDIKEFIKASIRARKDYKGSGQPTLFTTEDMLIEMLLLEDKIGHPLYVDEAALARKLRVKEIVTVPVMEKVKGKNGGALLGVIVNLSDYNVGADKGGAVSMFDDFDIDYNAQKYLIETRCSGALIKPYSAIALETTKSFSEVYPE